METYLINREGKKLFCRIIGEGTPVVLIHGSMVDADFFDLTQEYLSKCFKVITYDRRGYTRSEEAEDYSMARQADDLVDLIDAYADGKAIVVGCSHGALAALKALECYPDKLIHCYVHEPPLIYLENVTTEEEKIWLNEVDEYRRTGKIRRAVMHFVMGVGSHLSDPRARSYPPEKIDRQMRNGRIYIQKEYGENLHSQIITLEKIKQTGNITCMIGDSSPDVYTSRCAKALADYLGQRVVYCPGGHNGAHDLPAEFAAMMCGLINLYERV